MGTLAGPHEHIEIPHFCVAEHFREGVNRIGAVGIDNTYPGVSGVPDAREERIAIALVGGMGDYPCGGRPCFGEGVIR